MYAIFYDAIAVDLYFPQWLLQIMAGNEIERFQLFV
jgi:hypothetical protein